MPPKSKRQIAHQHDRRHETGLAQPGRRITKQRSSGQLTNDNVSTASKSKSQVAPLIRSEASRATAFAYASGPDESVKQTQLKPVLASVGDSYVEGEIRALSEVSYDGFDDSQVSDGTFEESSMSFQRYTKINSKTFAPVKCNKTLNSITTIISVCPLRDIVAILIILLQLPPTILTLIQFLFATLTFLPPTSIATLPSVSEILAGSGGMPSLATMLITDLIVLLLWLLIWVPAQNLLLDLAQAVIAIALGGAAAGKRGTTHSIVICVTVILLSHAFRSKPARNYGMRLLRGQIGNGATRQSVIESSSGWFSETLSVPRGWPRSILGIHILTQGLVRIVRRTLARKETKQPSKSGKRPDPEALERPQVSRSNSISHDPSTGTKICNGDARQVASIVSAKEGKDKIPNGKKKRKPANAIRTRQPFWAALASTKVTVCKEIENREAIADAIEANASSLTDVADSNFALGEGRFWISSISATAISFGACMEDFAESSTNKKDSNFADSTSVISNSPFFVRLNGAVWASTRAQHLGFDSQYKQWHIWAGEIAGLTPLSSYRCEFVRSNGSDILYAVDVMTRSVPSAEKEIIIPPTSNESLQPSSPLSTLQKSIATAEQKLQDHRNRLKRTRKDHKNTLAGLKREVDNLNSRKTSTSGSDDKLRQRELQLQQHIHHVQNATTSLISEIEALGGIPKEVTTRADKAKKRWDKACKANEASHNDLNTSKRASQRKLDAINAEIASALQKKERLQVRRAKLTEQRDRLVQATTEDAESRARLADQRATHIAQRATVEAQYLASIEGCERQTLDFNQKTQAVVKQMQQLEALMVQQQQHQHVLPSLQQSGSAANTMSSLSSFAPFSQATTPESLVSGSGAATGGLSILDRSPSASPLRGFSFPSAFDASFAKSPPRMGNGNINGNGNSNGNTSRSRLRSSSLLSAGSDFTDDTSPAATTRPRSSVIGDKLPLSSSPFNYYHNNLHVDGAVKASGNASEGLVGKKLFTKGSGDGNKNGDFVGSLAAIGYGSGFYHPARSSTRSNSQ